MGRWPASTHHRLCACLGQPYISYLYEGAGMLLALAASSPFVVSSIFRWLRSCRRLRGRCALGATAVKALSDCCCSAPLVVRISRNVIFLSQSLGWRVGNKNCATRECIFTRADHNAGSRMQGCDYGGNMRLVGSSAHAVSCSGSVQVGWGRRRRSGCLSCCVSS